MEWERSYWSHDLNILLDVMKNELFYLKTTWNVPGRPLFVMILSEAMVALFSKACCSLFS